MVVHIYGLPVDLKKILKIKKYNLRLIEDCAEQLGQTLTANRLVVSEILVLLVFLLINILLQEKEA